METLHITIYNNVGSPRDWVVSYATDCGEMEIKSGLALEEALSLVAKKMAEATLSKFSGNQLQLPLDKTDGTSYT
jgi:hypothetical protein